MVCVHVCTYICQSIVCIRTSLSDSHILEILSRHSHHVFNVLWVGVALVIEEGEVLFQMYSFKKLSNAVLQVGEQFVSFVPCTDYSAV